jgi:hypothetical protein
MADLHTITAYKAGSTFGNWWDIEETPLYRLAAAVLMCDFDNWRREEAAIVKLKREVGLIAERLKDDAELRRVAAAVVVMVMGKHHDGFGRAMRSRVRAIRKDQEGGGS